MGIKDFFSSDENAVADEDKTEIEEALDAADEETLVLTEEVQPVVDVVPHAAAAAKARDTLDLRKKRK